MRKIPPKKHGFGHMGDSHLFNYRKKSRQGGLRGWQNFSGILCRRRPREKTITLAQIKAIA
jgi:hypothetical protein